MPKKLQTVTIDQITNQGWVYIQNQAGLITQRPDKEAEQLLSQGWHLPDPKDVVIDYIKTTSLDWKLRFYVPRFDEMDALQGYTRFARALERGLNLKGIDFTPRLDNKVDLILVIDSVWCGAATGYLSKLKIKAKELNIPLAMFTMFETDHWIQTHLDEMENLDFVVVPNMWNKQTLKKQKFKKPVYVCPLPNPNGFEYLERQQHDKFTFLMYNAGDFRKGWPEYYNAFMDEFAGDEPVRFILKSRAGDDKRMENFQPSSQPKEIQWICVNSTPQQILDLHSQADCFVFPSKGEGWGYPPIESLLTGNPVICPNAHSIKDWFNHACLDIDWTMEPASFHHLGEAQEGTGNWFKPTVQSIRKQMRFIYEEYKREGRQARIFQNAKIQAQKIKEKYSQEAVADIFIDILVKNNLIEK